MSTMRKLLLLAMVFPLALSVAGCKKKQAADKPQPTASPSPTPTPTAQATPTPTPTPTATPTPTGEPSPSASTAPAVEPAKPSNPGGPGEAVGLTGDATAGEAVYAKKCIKCHGEAGKGGVKNEGSEDGTVPPLSPLDPSLLSPDPKVFATNVDLFLEHGSQPNALVDANGRANDPDLSMPSFGEAKKLTQQEIADVIAYVHQLNP